MSTLNPSARRSHWRDMIQLDLPGPECTLSTMQPIGAHLTIQISEEDAQVLHEQLSKVLRGEGDK